MVRFRRWDRRKGAEEHAEERRFVSIRRELEDFLLHDNNKVKKHAARQILVLFERLENENIGLRVKLAKLEGRLTLSGRTPVESTGRGHLLMC